MGLKENIWLWGQVPNSHHEEANNLYNLPGVNKMTPAEALDYFDIQNSCMIVMENKPAPPFDPWADALKGAKKVAWSILGSGGSERNNNGGSDIDEVLKLVEKYDNIVAGVADDFMRPERMAVYTPEVVAGFRDTLHNKAARKLDFWTVIYEHEINDNAKPYLDVFDVVSMWTWCAKNLKDLDENYNKLKKYLKDQPVMAGCYMWDYGDHRPMTMDNMKMQLDKYANWYEQGKIDGMILCSNCIADLGIDTVEYTKEWISKL